MRENDLQSMVIFTLAIYMYMHIQIVSYRFMNLLEVIQNCCIILLLQPDQLGL